MTAALPSLSKDLVDWAQLAGAFIGTVALVVAVFSIRKASRDLIRERQRIHEAEILREISEYIDRISAHFELRTLLMLLPGYDDMPMLRAAVGARPSKSYEDALRTKYPDSVMPDEVFDLHEVKSNYVDRLRSDGILRKELDDALNRRLDYY